MPNASLLLLLVPMVYLATAVAAARAVPRSVAAAWRMAITGAGIALLVTLFSILALVVSGPTILRLPSAVGEQVVLASVRSDALTLTMLTLVTSIALVIVRFARRYLDGDAGQPRFLRWFFATVAAASALVITNNLLVLAVAWTLSTLALHQLLTFYVDRPQAQIAAHKKFLLSRVADVAIFGAVALLWWSFGELELDRLFDRAAATPWPISASVAGVLLVLGVSLRSAQLPFHGWLIQVMEAPTPISALLHAGIVNIGGFVLIRLAPLMVRMEVAQLMLVVIGTTTAVLAALVISTRVSIKVMLAWSTAAQMGFMLIECGLGAYSLALLHLVAHSIYKAHAFLSSGRAVEQQTRRDMVPVVAAAGLRRWAASAVLGGALIIVIAGGMGLRASTDASLWTAALLLALAIAPLFVKAGARGRLHLVPALALASGIVVLYVGLHTLFDTLVPRVAAGEELPLLRLGIVVIAFSLLYVGQAFLAARPRGSLARALYPACFAGFYLDEVFTRLTFRLWPPRPVAQGGTVARVMPTPAMKVAA